VSDWLADTRASYDTVAADYSAMLRDALDRLPHARAALSSFASQVEGAVVDAGCGPGHVTRYLSTLGVDVSGVDLSPGMIDIARTEHPSLRFAVGSMTALDIADGSLGGVVAWWSTVHLPDSAAVLAFAEFRRVLRAGGLLLLGFHAGDSARLKTTGYGGHPMNVTVYRRPPGRVREWLRAAGFTVELEAVLDPDGENPGAVVFARAGREAVCQ
jgi:SAM-dependent methyltransferase